jgi:AcrR family transcriptional regulator
MQRSIRTYNKADELVASRRQDIAQCAKNLFVEKGYDKTSVREISDACGIGVGNIYRYVGSKEDILYMVLDYCISPIVQFCDDYSGNLESLEPTEALRNAMTRYYQMIGELKEVLLVAYLELRNMDANFRRQTLQTESRIVAVFERLLERGCEAGVFKVDNATLVAHSIVVLADMWAVRQWFFRGRYNLDEYVSVLTDFVLRAIQTDRGLEGEA